MEIPGGAVPSMSATSLSQLISWKIGKPGTPLLNSAKLPVLDSESDSDEIPVTTASVGEAFIETG
jgi:hypothetical protein